MSCATTIPPLDSLHQCRTASPDRDSEGTAGASVRSRLKEGPGSSEPDRAVRRPAAPRRHPDDRRFTAWVRWPVAVPALEAERHTSQPASIRARVTSRRAGPRPARSISGPSGMLSFVLGASGAVRWPRRGRRNGLQAFAPAAAAGRSSQAIECAQASIAVQSRKSPVGSARRTSGMRRTNPFITRSARPVGVASGSNAP